MFRGSLRDFLAGGTSSREKHLDKFYQFLSQGYWRLVCEGFCNSLAGRGPSCEKDLEKFSKIQVFRFLATQFGDLFASGSSNHKVYSKCFAAPFATFSGVELLVAKNTQTNFTNFCLKVTGDFVWRLVCEGFCNSLAGQGPSCEKDLENFSKIQVFRFLATQFGDLFANGSSNHEVYSECFAAPFATFSRVTKNTQTNFTNFCLKVIGNLFMTHFSHENRVFCTMRVFFRTGFKKISFSLASCDYSYYCPSFPLSKSPCSHTHSPFSSSLIHQFSSKGMGFVSFSMYFTFLTEDFLDWVFLMISVHMILEYGYLMLW